jgi:hypothetical protein
MLQTIIICSLFSYGAFTVQRPGFILDFMRSVWKLFPERLHETLYACGVCVASLWGGTCYVYIQWLEREQDNPYRLILWIPVILGAVSGLNAIIDRAVKAFEKQYGYKTVQKLKGEDQWKYLLPYSQLRNGICRQFITDNLNRGHSVIEVGGYSELYAHAKNYHSFSAENMLGESEMRSIMRSSIKTGSKYSVFILGLAFEGNLRTLKEFIKHSHVALIEYSDDGISRQQIELLTEGIKTKLLIPEYTINSHETPPQKCGSTEKRKVIILQP